MMKHRIGLIALMALSVSACQTVSIVDEIKKIDQNISGRLNVDETDEPSADQAPIQTQAKVTTRTASPYQSQIDQFIRLGDRTRTGGDLQNAIGFYQKAYALDKNYQESLFRLVDGLSDLGDRRGAERLLAEAVSENPNDVLILRKYGNVLIERDKLPQALIQFERALEISPDEPETLNSMAVAYDLQGRHQDAQELYQKSTALEPDNQRTLSNYALSLALSGDTKSAIEQLVQFETDPTVSKRLKLNLALIYGLDGQMEAARRVAGQVLDREAVENNIQVYEALRNMTADARKDALLKNPATEQSPE